MAEKMRKGIFDFNDMSEQYAQIESSAAWRHHEHAAWHGQDEGSAGRANLDEIQIKRQRAIIGSMTAKERRNPHILTDDPRKASRKKRIAAGAGANVEAVNKLIKQHRGMADMMKRWAAQRASAA